MRPNSSYENNISNSCTTPEKKYISHLYTKKKPDFCSCKYIPIKKAFFSKEVYQSPQKNSRSNRPVVYFSKTENKFFPYKTIKYTTKCELGKKYCYGEKIDEKDNYILFCSGSGTEVDEENEKFQKKKLIFNESYSSIKNKPKINYVIGNINEMDELNRTDVNFRYKDVKNSGDKYQEKKTILRNKIFTTPLKFKSNIKQQQNLYDKKIFGNNQKTKILKNSYSTNDFFNRNKLNFAQKNAFIKNKNKNNYQNKLFTAQKAYAKKTVIVPKIINKTKMTMANNKYGNTVQKVKTYKKSTKDCDYLVKVTTTKTEVPIQDTDEGIYIKNNINTIDYQNSNSRRKNFKVYNSNAKYHNNCLLDLNKTHTKYFRIIKSPPKLKRILIKKKQEKIEEVFCPIHGKSTWLCKKIS